MKKTMVQKRLGLKKATLSTLLAVLAICGPLSVSAADKLDLTSGDTHPNTLSGTSSTKDNTVAIGFDNSVSRGALAIGEQNTTETLNPLADNAVAIGRKNHANNSSIVVGYNNTGYTGSTVVGGNNIGSSTATVIGLNSKAAGGIAIGNGTKAGTFQYGKNLSDVKVLESSTAIGNKATALTGTSLGYNTKSDLLGVAIGSSASAMYGGVAMGSGSKIVRDTYSTYREKGVALGNKSVADRRFGTYGYMPLSDTATTLQTPDSMENDIALAKQTGDANVIKTVNDFYTNYGEDTYNKWKELKTASDNVYTAYNEKLAEINSKVYASEADRLADVNELQNLSDQQKTANAALSQFQTDHQGISAAIDAKDSALSTFKANASAVSVGRAATDTLPAITRQITNLAAGTADTDAVNVAQLKQVKTYADGIANTVKELTDKVASGSRDFAGDDKSKVSVKVGETMEITGGAATDNLSDDNIGVVAKDENGVSVKLSKDLKGLNTAEFNTSITVGTGDNKTVITGDSIRTGNTTVNNNGLTINNSDPTKNITIQDGNINMGGNAIHNVGEATEAGDAINKGQFDRTINNIGNGMNEMNGRINQIGRDVNRVGAGAAALASLHPLDFDPDDKGSFAVGFGSYKSEHAAALGAFYRPNEDTMVNLAATIGNNDNMYSAGVSFKIGSSSPYAHMSKSEMAVKLESQDKELTDQNQKIEALESQNQDLNARLAKLEALVASK